MSTEFRPIDRSRHKLLVVDDDPASRYATARLLKNAGFNIVEAATGMEGLEKADTTVSALVLDVHLPDIDGFELCRRLRSQPLTETVPVLHLSAAYVTDEDKVRGLDSGADAYLTHPVEPAVLVATVQALVRTRMAEEGMRSSEAKFKAIYAQVPGGICLLDAQGRFLDANPAMLRFLDLPFADISGRPVSEFVPTAQTASVHEFVTGAGTETARKEFPVLTSTGQATLLEWTLTQHVQPGMTLAVATDITHRGALEQKRQELMEGERVARSAAERISRMKDELIAVLSHELRTPLNAIMVWSHVLQKQADSGNDKLKQGLDAIERNGRIQARMISDILDMSRLNMGKMPLTLETVNPHEVIDAAVQAMQPTVAENEQRIVIEATAPHRSIRADSSRLQQVIWNLVSNAVKFSPKGAQVRIVLRDRDDGLCISIIDEGQGIEPDFLPYLFDRFTQSDAGSNRKRGGLGLGLSIVRHLIEAHGGTITAASEGAGKGARFDIWLPIEPPQVTDSRPSDGDEDDAGPAAESEGSLSGMHLLLVDDDRDACTMLNIILADRGAMVTTANSYDEALAVLGTLVPDVLISDVGMPGKDGYDLIRELRKRETGSGHRVPAIALTSFTRQLDQQQAMAAGFDMHCPKPLRPMKLIQAVQSLAASNGFGHSRH